MDGPPAGGVDIVVTGPDYDDIAVVSRDLAASLGAIEDIVNVENTVTQARPEVAIEVDPEKAAFLGLTTRQVAFQLSQLPHRPDRNDHHDRREDVRRGRCR